MLYDWANSAHSVCVVTILPIFFNTVAEFTASGESTMTTWGYATSIAMAVVALAAPVLGVLGDFDGMRKKLFTAALVIGVVFIARFWGAPYAEHEVLDTFLCNLYAWTAVLAVLAVMKKWGNFDNAFSKWMNRKSWGLYLFHYLPLAACAWYLHQYTALPALVVYLCSAVAAFAGAYLLYEMIGRIPVLRWCVCGIRGEK